MREEVVAVFIPIVMFLVIGLVLVTYYYLRSRERQLLIEKGLDAASIKEFFESKRDPFRLMKIGIISITFGLGIGFGLMLQDSTSKEYYVPLSIFVFTGIGFVAANLLAQKMNKKEKEISLS